MVDFLQNLIDGVMVGSSYALLALGFTLIFGVMRRLNLSYGPSIMMGVFAGTLLQLYAGAGPVMAFLATIAVAVLAGIYVERLCFGAIPQGAALASMVSTFAVWMQLQEIVTTVAPRRTYPFSSPIAYDPIRLGPWSLRVEYLVMFVCAAGLSAALYALFSRTRFGLAVRAVSQHPTASRFVGVNVSAVSFRAFVLASALGGLAGYLIVASDQQVTPMFGLWATLKGLIAMMLGGIGSMPGAIVGGLLLGVVEMESAWYLGTEYRDLVAYCLLFVFLIVRPGGILGPAEALEEAARRRV